MKTIILTALTALSLAACSGPTIGGQNDTSLWFPNAPHMMTSAGPYDTTANNLSGRLAGT